VRPTPHCNLVEQQQQVVLVAQLAQPAQEFRRAGMDARLTLDRLNHDRRGLVVDQVGKTLQVVSTAKGKNPVRASEALLDFSCGVALMPPNMRP